MLLDRRAGPTVRDGLRAAIENDGDNRLADLHVWSIGAGIHAAAISLVTHQPRSPAHYKALIPEHLGVVHATVEVQACRSGAESAACPPETFQA